MQPNRIIYCKKRRLGITSKTALFCCGSERTLHGETAAEEIGVRPNLVWWSPRDGTRTPKIIVLRDYVVLRIAV